jgi:hypothetical protein
MSIAFAFKNSKYQSKFDFGHYHFFLGRGMPIELAKKISDISGFCAI